MRFKLKRGREREQPFQGLGVAVLMIDTNLPFKFAGTLHRVNSFTANPSRVNFDSGDTPRYLKLNFVVSSLSDLCSSRIDNRTHSAHLTHPVIPNFKTWRNPLAQKSSGLSGQRSARRACTLQSRQRGWTGCIRS